MREDLATAVETARKSQGAGDDQSRAVKDAIDGVLKQAGIDPVEFKARMDVAREQARVDARSGDRTERHGRAEHHHHRHRHHKVDDRTPVAPSPVQPTNPVPAPPAPPEPAPPVAASSLDVQA